MSDEQLRDEAAIAESMRLYPPAWGFSRTVLEDTTLDAGSGPTRRTSGRSGG